MYQRLLTIPDYSFFLFGPRSTGKTTWLKQVLPEEKTKVFDLLLEDNYLPLLREPELFRGQVEGSNAEWILVDEVQKLPSLLNQVHHLTQKHPNRFKFALSGSSARKLRRLDSNLLAGRAIQKEFYPLVCAEIGTDFNLEFALAHGTLPNVVSNADYGIQILDAYTHTYITQEIHQETLIRDIEPFARFLKVAAIMNGQVLNISSIARDAAVGRTTAERYFEILRDTLIGVFVPSWSSGIRVKEVNHPKFYLFDPGIVRSIRGTLRDKLEQSERGPLLETLVLHELRAWSSYTDSAGDISHWRTSGGIEVDFIWTRGPRAIGIEVKSSSKWRREWGNSVRELLTAKRIQKGFVIYTGTERIEDRGVLGIPFQDFALSLYQGLFENEV